jgi:hypothetical protein
MAMSRAEALTVFRNVLNRHPEVGPVDFERLRFTDEVVTETQDGGTSLSDAILDSCFPHSDTTIEYAHYTRFSTLQGLVATGQWRLYWVYKRLNEAEFTTFSNDHGLDGYFDTDPHTGRPIYEDLCRDLFYTSLTRHPSANADDMWEAFGEQGRGVRLIFRVQPVLQRSEFRPVRYKNALSRTIIQELSQAAQGQLQRRLVLMGISRIGAFYLPLGFVDEQESRLLVKRFHVPNSVQNPWAGVQADGLHQYLPVPLNQDNDFCRLDLVRVDPGPLRSRRDVDRELRRNPRFAHLARRGCLGLFIPYVV